MYLGYFHFHYFDIFILVACEVKESERRSDRWLPGTWLIATPDRISYRCKHNSAEKECIRSRKIVKESFWIMFKYIVLILITEDMQIICCSIRLKLFLNTGEKANLVFNLSSRNFVCRPWFNTFLPIECKNLFQQSSVDYRVYKICYSSTHFDAYWFYWQENTLHTRKHYV